MFKFFKRINDLERRVQLLEDTPHAELRQEPDLTDEQRKLADEAERLYSEGVANILGYDYTKKRDE